MTISQRSIAILLTTLPFIANAQPDHKSKLVNIKGDFTFQLFLGEVECWRDGPCQGEVVDREGPVAEALHEILGRANSEVDLAIYGLRNQQWFLDSLKKLRQEKIKTRLTLDQVQGPLGDWGTTENFPYPDASKIVNILGVNSVKPDTDQDGSPRGSTIMHNKFFVLDRKSVWLGSSNVSESETGSGYNANSSIFIECPEIAEVYHDEFEQMFVLGRYSLAKVERPLTKQQTFRFADNTEVRVFFSPQDRPLEMAIIPFIDAAKETLDIGMFFLTEPSVAQAMVNAQKRGVKVRLLADAVGASNPASKHYYLRERGVSVKIENWGGKMHMKTAIADGKNVIIGSMNWTNDGGRANDENTLWIKNNKNLADQLSTYFNNLWDGISTEHDPKPEGFDSINSCYDGFDNNYDGLADNQDQNCK